MDFSNHPLNRTTVTTVSKNINTTVTTVGTKYKTTELLYSDLDDLVNERFKKWYCKKFHQLGKERVLELASVARQDGRNPRTYFAWLLKH